MKNTCFLILLIYFNSLLLSQSNTLQPKKYFSVLYGKKFLQESSFNSQLNSLDRPSFQGPLSIAGFEMAFLRYRGPGNSRILYRILGLNFILPANVQINDSTTAKLWGIQGEILPFEKNFRNKKKTSGVTIHLGFNTGRMNLKKNDALRLKNNYFSPKLSIRPWILMKSVRLGFICEYEYDVSKKNWKPLKNSAGGLQIEKMSLSGLSLLFNLGLFIL